MPVLQVADSLAYLFADATMWSYFLNKAAYCRRTRRALYLGLGSPVAALRVPPPAARPPWLPCEEERPPGVQFMKPLFALAVFALRRRGGTGERRHPALFAMDADAWFATPIEPPTETAPGPEQPPAVLEAYLRLAETARAGAAATTAAAAAAAARSPQPLTHALPSLAGASNKHHPGARDADVVMNGGLLLWRNDAAGREMLALWYRGRCHDNDQLSLWATIFEMWRVATNGSFDFAPRLFSRYAYAHARAKPRLVDAVDGGEFGAAIRSSVARGRRAKERALLALPHVTILPHAVVSVAGLPGWEGWDARIHGLPPGQLPPLRSVAPAANERRANRTRVRPLVCHTHTGKTDPDGVCTWQDGCTLGKCEPFWR